MLILAVDTSGKNGSVALCRFHGASFEVLSLRTVEGGTYSSQLVPLIADLLRSASLVKSQIDGFVVVDGPGSFTGLRVGLSTVKGLCVVIDKPVAVVSMLEALAITNASDGEKICSVLDAGRGEVYVGEYLIVGQNAELLDQFVVKLADVRHQVAAMNCRGVTLSSNVVDAAGSAVTQVGSLHADSIARIGLRKLLSGQTVDPATLDANYIRRSDAELYSPPKR